MRIYSHLAFGLGNQLFQFGAGYALARKNDCELVLDTSWYNNNTSEYTKREFGLFHLLDDNIKYISQYTNYDLWRDRLCRLSRFSFRQPYRFCVPIWKPNGNHNKRFCDISWSVCLMGVFGSYRYFYNVKQDLHDKIKNTYMFITDRAKEIEREIKSVNPCAIHVRRGDFISNPKIRVKYYTLGEEYYREAIRKFEIANGQSEFFVFSDDIEQAKSVFKFHRKAQFVQTGNELDDLLLMAQCSGAIIANSTFSWWGAWLQEDNRKMTIFPKSWRKDSGGSPEIPAGWIEV